MDSKNISILTLCDLSKAFDSVSHRILLNKCAQLNTYSFWFERYLSDRTQSCRFSQKLSDRLNVSYGVSIGSILGPILFSIYVNNLAERINACCLVQYVDHTQFLHADTINNLNDLISNTEETLLNVKHFCLRNGLLLNPKKT